MTLILVNPVIDTLTVISLGCRQSKKSIDAIDGDDGDELNYRPERKQVPTSAVALIGSGKHGGLGWQEWARRVG